MKKFLPISFIIVGTQAWAQQPSDALRFSYTVPYGSARQQAIGGAMTSLGGDISAAFTNPAGLGFYRTGDFLITPLFRFNKNKATYQNRKEAISENNIGIGTTGVVLGGGTGTGRIRSSAIAFAINGIANFREEVLYRGSNNKSSYSQTFLEQIKGVGNANTVAGSYPFGTSLAFNTFWIDTIGGGSNGSFRFQSRAANLLPDSLLQQQTTEHRGGITELTIAGGVNLNDKWLLGGGLALPILRFKRTSTFTEADATTNTANKFNYASIEEVVQTRGTGFKARLGAIYKPSEYWRLGVSFETPTIYSLEDITTVKVTTDTEGYKGLQTQSNRDVTGDEAPFKYMMTTPYRVAGSISYVLREIQDVTKQRGFLTADVEFVNYKAASYFEDTEEGSNPDNKAYLDELNNAIDLAYKPAFNFKLGGELKFTTLMVRLGAAYFGNPYKNLQGEKGQRINLSAGLGYRHRGQFIDLTYVHSMGSDVQLPYRLAADSPTAAINNRLGTVLLTYGVKLY